LTLQEIGVSIDNRQAIWQVFQRNETFITERLVTFLTAYYKKKSITVPLRYSQRFEEYIAHSIFTLTSQQDEIALDTENHRFKPIVKEQRFQILSSSLISQLNQHITETSYVYSPSLVRAPSTRIDEIQQLNQKLDILEKSDFSMLINDPHISSTIIFSGMNIVSVIHISYNSITHGIEFAVDDSAFRSIIQPTLDTLALSMDMKLMKTDVQRSIIEAISEYFMTGNLRIITVTPVVGPNTDGTNYDAYIEVDISQQKMYLFSQKSVHATYNVSTGKYLPTPTGEFHIINKAASGAYSSIWHVYMPYWMAFYYDEAYYGIHELPFYYSSDGKKIQRPREFIGSPNTGGCVALDIGEAEKVFEFAEVGMPVLIFE
jgi:hypothetical protein